MRWFPQRLVTPERRLRGRTRQISLGAGILLLGAPAWLYVASRRATPMSPAAAQPRAAQPLVQPAEMDSAASVVERLVARGLAPGAAVAAGYRDHVVELRGFGHLTPLDGAPAASATHTMYDLASLTKAVATTTAVLLLAQDGVIQLDDPVQPWLDDFDGEWKDKVTWRHLLTHTSGLPPAGHMAGDDPAARLRSVARTKLVAPPGVLVMYSDIGFILLWEAAQHAAGEPLPRYLERRVWRPLGMTSTAVWPGLDCERCAPTLVLESGEPYRGKPADPIAHELGVPSGNAGLFATAHDLARFAAMIANDGKLDGVRILRADLVHQLLRQSPGAGHRSLGWDAFCPAEEPNEDEPCRAPIAYGHTGYTGTSLWVDPVRRSWVVLLSNRTYLSEHPPSFGELRRELFLRVSRAVGSPQAHTDRRDSAD